MQRVISHAEQRLCNNKNQEKTAPIFFNGIVVGFNGTVFLSTVPSLGGTVPLLVQWVTNMSHYQCT